MTDGVEDRLPTLRWLYGVTKAAILGAPDDRKSALIAQLRGISEDIAALGGDSPKAVERNGLIDFQNALAERQQSDSSRQRRSAKGDNRR